MSDILSDVATVRTLQQKLFDKRINISLYRDATAAEVSSSAGAFNVDQTVRTIIIPETGRKPNIRLSGKMVAQTTIQQMELRITNFFTDVPLSEYKKVVLEAGYANSLRVAMKGEILNSFTEQPGPDGVTFFQVMVGQFTDWMSKTLSTTFNEGTPFESVLKTVANALGLTAISFAATGQVLPFPLSYNGLAKEWLEKLKGVFPAIIIKPDGSNLIAYQLDRGGTGIVYVLDFVSDVKKNAAGFDIQAPWIPSISRGTLFRLTRTSTARTSEAARSRLETNFKF